MLKQIAKLLTKDPQQTKLWATAAGAVVCTFLFMFVFGGCSGPAAQPEAPTGVVATTEAAADATATGTASPDANVTTPVVTPTPPATAAVETVAIAFTNAWLRGPAFERSNRGHATWVETVAPYANGGTKSMLMLQALDRIPTTRGGALLQAASVTTTAAIGDSQTLNVTLTDRTTLVVDVGAVGQGWLVTGYTPPVSK